MPKQTDDKAPPEEPSDLLEYSQAAIKQRAVFLANASDFVTVSNALAIQWLEMNRKFFDRANKRLEVARDSIVDGGEAAGQSMSYHERSEKFQNLAIENVKDYFQQFERFSVGASVLAQRMMEKYKDLPVGQMMPKDPPV